MSANKFSALAVPLAPLEEQQHIAQLIELNLSIHKQIETIISENIVNSEVLYNSILKKAFSGRLVPQEPNDEPASILLERIRAKRQVTPKPTRKLSTSRRKSREKEVVDLVSVLESAGNWLSAQDAFQLCGVSDGAETEVIEKLYLELRDLEREALIEVERRGDEDWLRIRRIGRS